MGLSDPCPHWQVSAGRRVLEHVLLGGGRSPTGVGKQPRVAPHPPTSRVASPSLDLRAPSFAPGGQAG